MAETNGTKELYKDGWCIFQTTFFGRWTGVYGFIKYTESGNVLETITEKGFKGSFRIRGPCADKQ